MRTNIVKFLILLVCLALLAVGLWKFMVFVPLWFIVGFFAFIVGFGSLIAFCSVKFSGRIGLRPFSLVEGMLIAGIIGGVVAMFQPWSMALYGFGFNVLLICVLSFTLWSHIAPRTRPA